MSEAGPQPVLVRRHGDFFEVAALDHETGELRSLEVDPHSVDEHGDFTWLGGHLMAIYRKGDGLFIRLDDRRIPVRPTLRAELQGRVFKRLRLVGEERRVAEVKYRRGWDSFAYRFDSLAYQDDVAHDFGKLVAQIVNGPGGHDEVYPAGRGA